jgi:putative tryptophan/tyrosine transport system substrate-binding protein
MGWRERPAPSASMSPDWKSSEPRISGPPLRRSTEAQALYVCADSLISANHVRINAFALAVQLPTLHYTRDHVEPDGLMSYGPNYSDLFRRAADLVDKILRGAKPADIPVEQPTRFELVINVKVAKALGLTISEAFLLRADELID